MESTTSRSKVQSLSPELLTHIVSYFQNLYDTPRSHSYGDRSTLIALTRTCRTLSEAALNRLWQDLPCLAPLVYTIPRDAWTMSRPQSSESGYSPGVLIFSRSLVPSDYNRLLTYAPRVMSLVDRHSAIIGVYCPRLWGIEMDPDVLPTLESSCPTPVLLPNVRELTLAIPSSHIASSRRFITPSLTKLKYRVNVQPEGALSDHEQDTEELVTKLRRFCPHLQDLTLELLPCTRKLQDLVSTALLGIRSLTAFSSGKMPILPSTLATLSRFPTLNTLQVTLELTQATDVLQDLPENAFCALRGLKVSTDNADIAHAFLGAIASQDLNALEITYSKPVPSESIRSLFAMLSQRQVHLQKLLLNISCGKGAGAPVQDILPAEILHPLFGLHELTTVDLRGCPIIADDPVGRAIPVAWPKITTLLLGVGKDSPDHPPSPVSLSALAYLVHRCRSLEVLGLPINTDLSQFALGVSGLLAEFEIPPSRVNRLSVGRSEVRDPIALAGFLSDLFPDLQFIETSWSYDDNNADDEDDELELEEMERHEVWLRVEGLILDFMDVRIQEGDGRRSMARTQGGRRKWPYLWTWR